MANNKISSSKKEIYTKLLDIANKYVKIDETNFLTSGLFGYITEMQAMALRDSAIHKEMVYNEHFLNKAVIPESVYNYAKMFNVEVKTATPAYANIEIVIPQESFDTFSKKSLNDADKEKYGADLNNFRNEYIVIDKENIIVAGDYIFSLEHSVLLYKDDDGYRAQYITSDYTSTNFQSNFNKYLTTTIETSDSTSNIVIKTRIYQYDQTVIDRVITGSTFTNKIQKFEFSDQFCGASLFYIENGKRKEIALMNTDASVIKDSAFYNFSGDNEIEVVFKLTNDYFQPSQNSELEMHVYTTKGADVPAMYKDNGIFQFSDSSMKSFPVVVRFSAPYQIIGGHDKPTLDKIKQNIVSSISTRNTITTNSDLENYFSILTSLIDDVNNGKVTFKKTQDDLLKRVYNSYLLLRDNTDDVNYNIKKTGGYISSCVPTNDITIKTKATDIPAGTKFIKSTETINSTLNQTINDGRYYYNDVPSDKSANYPTNYYVSPFSIKIENNKVQYTYDATDDSCELVYDFSNCGTYNTHSIIPQSVRVQKTFGSNFSLKNSKYIYEFTFTTDFDILKEFQTTNFESAKIKIDDKVLENTERTTKLLDCISIDSVVIDDAGTNFLTTIKFVDNSTNAYNETNIIKLNLADIGISLAFIGIRKLRFYSNMSKIMSMDLSVIDSNTIITDLPVIHSSFFDSSSNVATQTRCDGFVKQLFTYIDILNENLERLENSTFFNLKFYNTYGPSYLYSTSSTNIKLELLIILNSKVNEYTASQVDTLKAEIRSYIRRLFDDMNVDQQISISSLISIINNESTYGKYIGRIEFRGLNDTFEQVIKSIDPSTVDTTEYKYPPEWLNLDATSLKNSIVIMTEIEEAQPTT